MRTLMRRVVPLPLRTQLRQFRRRFNDTREHVRFAGASARITGTLPIVVATYERPVTCYPGQEARLGDKLHNLELACQPSTAYCLLPAKCSPSGDASARPLPVKAIDERLR